LLQRIASSGKGSDEQIAAARLHINEQIADPLDFDDNVAPARLDVKVEALQEERLRYEQCSLDYWPPRRLVIKRRRVNCRLIWIISATIWTVRSKLH
jgi:hypothetical protein